LVDVVINQAIRAISNLRNALISADQSVAFCSLFRKLPARIFAFRRLPVYRQNELRNSKWC